jgi:hypothetical protein
VLLLTRTTEAFGNDEKDGNAHYRTSSAANVGDDKDTLMRQRSAVEAYAARGRIELIGEYYDSGLRRRRDLGAARFHRDAVAHRGQRRADDPG